MEEQKPFRLKKRLLLDGKVVPLLSEQVRLGLGQVGEGLLRVARGGREPVGALAELFVGVGDSQQYQVITGIVWRIRKGGTDWMLHLHEATQSLKRRVHLQLDDCNAREVVAEVGLQCGLTFVTPKDMLLLNKRHAKFDISNLGTEVLSLVGKAWRVPGVTWSQLPNGHVYWGPWRLAPFVGKPLGLENKLVSQIDLERGIMEMPYIPAFRPGILLAINIAQQKITVRIDQLIFSGQSMRVHWTAC